MNMAPSLIELAAPLPLVFCVMMGGNLNKDNKRTNLIVYCLHCIETQVERLSQALNANSHSTVMKEETEVGLSAV